MFLNQLFWEKKSNKSKNAAAEGQQKPGQKQFLKRKEIKTPKISFPAPPCEEFLDLKPPNFPGKASPAASFVPRIPDKDIR